MKKAKVVRGVVHHVWPSTKTLPDGTQVVKELPSQYQGLAGKPVPDCIVDVPDDVQPKWRWDADKQAYVAPEKKNWTPFVPHSDLLEVVAEAVGVPYETLLNQVIERKKARRKQG